MFTRPDPQAERRRYVRLDSVFPVQFRIYALDGITPLSDWLQGYTHNIGKGGILLNVHDLNADLALLVKTRQATVALKIEMPLNRPAVAARASVAWVQDKTPEIQKLGIGLSYVQIDSVHKMRLLRYAWTKKMVVPAFSVIVVALALALGAYTYVNVKLIEGNKALVAQLIEILRESTSAKQKIKDISRDKEDAQRNLQTLQVRIQALEDERAAQQSKAQKAEKEKTAFEEKAKDEMARAAGRIRELNDMLDKLTKDKASFQDQLISLQQKENTVTEELLRLDQRKSDLQKANFDKMYRWLTVHQNPRTGLVMSYEGDRNLQDWAFIYDQSLVAQTYVNFSDFERARKLLDFFSKKAKKVDGLFVNAYFVNDGSPVEYIVHSGPNIWLGLAALRYTKKTADIRFLPMAEDIARGVMDIQSQDPEGGIRGGPTTPWYATEHNLDAYAYFNMLYDMTKKDAYRVSRDKVLQWLMAHSYDKSEVPIKRGKGDSTIATDTYAWSIAALGPEKLTELGMNPDMILEFARDNCEAEVEFTAADGKKVVINGFDFAPQRNVARGGVISSEWTAQMIISYRIMADYYRAKGISTKALAYEKTADDYLASLCNMIISSPSPTGQGEGCLPYASADSVDTGHGWITPQGKTTGSVSGTAYTIFAYYNYNPLYPKDAQ
ncbi:MAG: hypothetical protein WCY10_00555 [Candidatus Omnitrophota bacterium]